MKLLLEIKVTLFLILANAIVFVGATGADPTIFTLLENGALFAPYALSDEPFRILYSMFLHGGIWHFAVNMLSLFLIGWDVEKRLGSGRYLLLYTVSGVVAAYFSLSFNLFTVAVGASGAIFGLYGYDLAAAFLGAKGRQRVFVLVNFLVYAAIIYLIGETMQFDHFAHLGGLLAGLTFFLLSLLGERTSRWSYAIWGLLIPFYFLLPRFQVRYFEAFQYFLEKDQKIEEKLNSKFGIESEFAAMVREVQHLPDSMESRFSRLDYVPEEIQADTARIMAYLELERQLLDHIVHGLGKESYIYYDSIWLINAELAQVEPLDYQLNMNPPDTTRDQQEATPPAVERVFYDAEWVKTDSKLEAKYYRLGQIDSLGDWHGQVEDYFLNGSIQMKGVYNHGLKDGVFLYYSDHGTYTSAGRYRDDLSIGKWEIFHNNGQLQEEIRYTADGAKILNAWDSLGQQVVAAGSGIIEEYYPDGQLKSTLIVEDSVRKYAEGYYPGGALHYRERFENNRLTEGYSIHEGVRHTYDFSTFIPYPSGGFDSFYEEVYESGVLQSDTTDSQVVLAFTVTSEGLPHNFRYLERMGHPYDLYVQRLVMDRKWYPALLHGYEPVASDALVNIRF